MRFLIIFLFFVAISLLTHVARKRRYGSPIRCYICNSHYQENCSEINADSDKYIYNCPYKLIDRKVRKPLGCRVLKQRVPNIANETALHITARECAYNKNFERQRFVASEKIRYSAFQCFVNKKNAKPCNDGNMKSSSLVLIAVYLLGISNLLEK